MSETHEFDAGTMGCAEGLTQEFKRQINALPAGDVLVVTARDPVAEADLPALARMLGHKVRSVEITHHVGYATFQPIRVERVEDHRIGSESFHISAEAASCINRSRARGGRLIAVGTTTVRALESSVDEDGRIRAGAGSTVAFTYAGSRDAAAPSQARVV